MRILPTYSEKPLSRPRFGFLRHRTKLKQLVKVIVAVAVAYTLFSSQPRRNRLSFQKPADFVAEPGDQQCHTAAPTNNRTGHRVEAQKPKPEGVIYRHEHWQVQADGDDELVLYSAFYDDRPIVGRLPWLRILGVLKITAQVNRKLFCYVWYSDVDSPHVVEADVLVTGRDHNISGGVDYGQRLFSCQLPSNTIFPTNVSVVPLNCANITTLLPVVVPERPPPGRWRHQFSVCVEQSFGSFSVEQIVEWIEAYWMFGVTHFGIYDGNLTDPLTMKALDWYVRQGLVELRRLPPSVDDYSEEGVRLSSPTSLNDCMMRHMYSSRFVVVVDLDEIIVPRMHENYAEMIADIDRHLGLNESYHTYSFRNAYFFTYWPQDVTQPVYLHTMRFRHRAPPSECLFGAKSFVDPRRCLSVFNHYCWIRFSDSARGGVDRGISVDVPTTHGLSHHYRQSCPFDKGVCDRFGWAKVADDVMLRFKPVLVRAVARSLTVLGIRARL